MEAFLETINECMKLIWVALILGVTACITGLFTFSRLAVDILVEGFSVQNGLILIVAASVILGFSLMGILVKILIHSFNLLYRKSKEKIKSLGEINNTYVQQRGL